MFARDYRAQAREALRGKWVRVALLMLLAAILGAGTMGSGSGVSFSASDVESILNETVSPQLRSMLIGLATLGTALAAWSFFMGSYVNVGMTGMLNRTLDGETPRAGMLFPKGVYWKSLGMNFMRSLFIFLWSLLFVIPGIIAAYRFSMADYLLSVHPEMGVMEVLQESKARMAGRKWRMFCLELSFIGWDLLSMIPGSILTASALWVSDGRKTGLSMFLFFLGILLMFAGALFVVAYMNTAVVAFFRDANRAGEWRSAAEEGETYAEEAYGSESFVSSPVFEAPHLAQPAAPEPVLNADETVARDMFFDYRCSRRRMRDAGVLEEYDALNASPVSQERWKREYGDTLMRRFDQDSAALDDILELAAEYAMPELSDRALQRIERHIRQQTLPDAEILNMAGRALALITSGAFAQSEGFVERKRQQVSDMADRLEKRLSESQPGGEWEKAMQLIRQMCG